MKRFAPIAVLLVLVPQPLVAEGADVSPAGAAVGRPAPPWLSPDWMGSKPLLLEELSGKVVLVRWWTGPNCPYCRASSSWLNAWNDEYAHDGLVTVGFYHDKGGASASSSEVRRLASDLGFTFPVAIDPEWRTLRSWWLDGNPGGFTSVTFLLDKKGIVRLIHPGGSYNKEEASDLEARITTLLDEE